MVSIHMGLSCHNKQGILLAAKQGGLKKDPLAIYPPPHAGKCTPGGRIAILLKIFRIFPYNILNDLLKNV